MDYQSKTIYILIKLKNNSSILELPRTSPNYIYGNLHYSIIRAT